MRADSLPPKTNRTMRSIEQACIEYLEYEVRPGSNVAQGLPRQRLVVLSPIWRAPALTLEYPDGEVHTLVGWSGSAPRGPSCDLQDLLDPA